MVADAWAPFPPDLPAAAPDEREKGNLGKDRPIDPTSGKNSPAWT
jgi:hypothetical protein